MDFLDVKTDYAFKKVFGSEESKAILLSFLNAVLEFGQGRVIEDLTILDPYNIPVLKGMKDTFVDVKAKLSDDSKVIIEMQVLNHDGFEKRILYNTAKNYSEQLHKGNDYHLLNPVIALTIVNFEMFEFEKYKSSFKLLEKEHFTSYKDDIELVFIELPKFKKELKDCHNIEDKWLYFIKNSENLSLVPKNIDKNIQEAYDIANTANYTIDELELQRKRKEFIYIQRKSIEKAKRDGHKQGHEQGWEEGNEKGREEGREEGKRDNTLEIVLKSFAQRLDIQTIAMITGLSVDELERLQSKV